jgi:hypothetical protein
MTKTDLYGSCTKFSTRVWHLRFAHAARALQPAYAAPTGSGFRYNFSKKLSPGPKSGLERRPLRFSTISAKNQVLKLKIDKVTVIIDLNCPFVAALPCSLPVKASRLETGSHDPHLQRISPACTRRVLE